MKRFYRTAAWTLILVLGISVGGGPNSWQPRAMVQAAAPQVNAAEAVYEELSEGHSPLVAGGQLLAKVAALTTPSVVHIQSERQSTKNGRVEETGSGVLISSDKTDGVFAITNRHVVSNAGPNAISIHLYDGRVIRPEQIWTDAATDVAVLKVSGQNLQPARWGDSDKTEIGHMVLAMGSPFGLSRSVTLGIISAKGRRSLKLGNKSEVLNQDFLQTDAAINPGNSGGPLIDLHGRVVGINTAIASNSGGNEGIGFSIPSNLVRRVVDQLLEHGKVHRAYLGVKLDPDFTSDTATRLKLDRICGARVVEVYPNTPASKANIKFDDVILSFDGIDVQDENHLINLVSLTPIGKQVRMLVSRDGKTVTVTVDLEDRSALDERSEAPLLLDEELDSIGGRGPAVENTSFTTRRPGLTLHEVDAGIARQLGFSGPTRGLVVLDVDRSNAGLKDLELYDVVEEVARKPVASLAEYHAVVEQHAGEPLLLKIRRCVEGKSISRLVIVRGLAE